jgi:hypothetical protein
MDLLLIMVLAVAVEHITVELLEQAVLELVVMAELVQLWQQVVLQIQDLVVEDLEEMVL